jgi:hypothetical protein
MDDFRAGTRKVQFKPGTSCSREQVLNEEKTKDTETNVKGF